MTGTNAAPRVAVVMPLNRHVPPAVLVGLAALLRYSFEKSLLSDVVFSEGTLVDDARNHLVRQVFQNDPTVTHLMWVDSDVVPPPDAVERLLAHDKAIVGGLYHQKAEPYRPLVYDLDPYRLLESTFSNMSLRRVGGLGLGCVLVRSDVYKQLSERFQDVRWYELSYGTGEDVHFFERCNEIGVEVWLDPAVRCGHVRDQVLVTDDWERARRAPPRRSGP